MFFYQRLSDFRIGRDFKDLDGREGLELAPPPLSFPCCPVNFEFHMKEKSMIEKKAKIPCSRTAW